ncbi:MAG: ACP S-malonyltransferase [Candidatus Eisenbacteria bacterium]|nr:ACP S-malonyltransferase [Candidatus Eisenbacteria bacterium]
MSAGFGYLFPGQGSQFVGMGRSLREEYPETREIFDVADEVMEIPLSKIAFEGPEETLRETRYTQPAILMVSLAILKLLDEKGWRPGIVAGHSLGEYSALVAARVLEPRDALAAVKRRAELMFMAGERWPGTMAAVLGLSADQVTQVCREAEDAGIVRPANFNAPGQIVISGEVPAVERAMELAADRGAKKVVPLPVSGAFHSELMGEASEGLRECLEATPFRDAEAPVVVNVDAVPMVKGADLRDALVRQLRGAVRWEDGMRRMGEEGFTRFYEVGPGRVLKGLARKIDRSFEVDCIEDAETFRKETGV